jgi:hypothetical protein
MAGGEAVEGRLLAARADCADDSLPRFEKVEKALAHPFPRGGASDSAGRNRF